MSPDGRRIAVLQRRFNGENGFDLVIRSLDTGAERAYPQSLGLGQRMPRWLPSGDAVLVEAVTGRNGEGAAIYRMDLETGEFRRLYSRNAPDHTRSPAFALSADGSRTYHTFRHGPDNPTTPWEGIVAVRLVDGVEEPIAKFPGDGYPGVTGLATSPDGAQVAVYAMGGLLPSRLIVARTDGSGLVEVSPTFESRGLPGPIAWSRDGLHLIVPVGGLQRQWETRRVSVPGMATSTDSLSAATLDGARGAPGAIDLSRDGGRLLVGAESAPKVDFWVLDNLTAWLQSRP